jgi:hypothetical protein
MSSESTPVLCGAIASFELLMTKWERLGEEHPELQYWTQIGLHWARKYYKRMDDTDAYVIAMGGSLFSDYSHYAKFTVCSSQSFHPLFVDPAQVGSDIH